MENKNIITTILAIGLILISLFLVYQAKETTASVLTVNGNYKTQIAPDQSKITFSMITLADTASEASSKNSEILTTIITKLKEAGLTDKDIETLNYDVHKKTEWENQKMVNKGYEAVNTIKLTIKDLTKVGIYLDILTKNGINQINSVRFDLSNDAREKAYQDALAKAGENAKSRAEGLAKGLGTHVKKIKSISLTQPMTPIYYNMAYSELKAETTATTLIQPKSVDLDVMVTVVFEI